MGSVALVRLVLGMAALIAAATPVTAAGIRLAVEPTRLTLDDEAYLTVTLEGDLGEYQAPVGDCYELSSPSQSTRLSIVNGRRSQSAELQYRLTPTRAGTCVVGPARVRTERGWEPSNTVQITIARGAEAPKVTPEEAEALDARASEPFFVRPLVPTRALYPGEPFVLGYDLWVRSDVAVSDAAVSAEPALPGFLSEDLLSGKRPKGHRQAIGRTTYTVYPLVRLLATPLKAGQTEIGAIEVQVVTGDVFRARRYKARSPIVTLVVRALPDDRPPSFDAGSIGTFTLAGTVDKAQLSLGEALVYTLTLQGSGNLERLNAPPFPTVEGLSAAALPSGADDEVLKDLEGVHGVRRFQYVLRPTREGPLELPPVRWAFFDPAVRRFVTLETAPVTLVVGAALPSAGARPGSHPASTAIEDTPAEGPLPLAEEPLSLDDPPVSPAEGRALPLALLVLAALVVLGAEVRHRVRRHRAEHRAEYAEAAALGRARRALAAVRPGEPSGPRALRSAVDAFLADRLRLEAGRWSLAEIERALVDRGIPAAAAAGLREALEACELAAYAPGQATELERLRDRTIDLLVEVDRAAA